jgi:hypothetical protein
MRFIHVWRLHELKMMRDAAKLDLVDVELEERFQILSRIVRQVLDPDH